MPVALFVCPHCDKHAEVHVTSVTRSRPCPHCNEMVVLQVSVKEKNKRRALLVGGPNGLAGLDEAQKPAAPGPAYEPQLLEGDVLDRMRLDPEVKATRRRLIMGLAAAASVVLVAVIWHAVGDKVVASLGGDTSAKDTASTVEIPEEPRGKAAAANTIGMRRGETDASSESKKLIFNMPEEKKDAPAEVAGSAKADASNGERIVLPANDPRLQAAVALEHFLKAQNLDGMLSVVADRATFEPHIRRYVEQHPIEPKLFEKMTIANTSGPIGERMIQVTLKDGREIEAMIVHEDGRCVVDWPSFVAWSEMEWSQFIAKKPEDPVLFRVIATEDKRFDNQFADHQKFACVKLSDPRNDKSSPLYAYVERNSVMGHEVEQVLKQAQGKPAKLTLNLRYPKSAKSEDQVWIDNVLASGWLVPKQKATAQLGAE